MDIPTIQSSTGKSAEQLLKEAQQKAALQTQGAKDIQSQLADYQLPTSTDWLNQQGLALVDPTQTEAYTGLGNLATQVQAGYTPEQQQQASDYAAGVYGLTGDQLNQTIGDLTTQMTAGPEAAQGMSPEEQALRQRQIRADIRGQQTQATQMLDDIQGQTGSRARALMAADQMLSSMQDSQLKQEVALADEQYQRKLAQYQGLQNTWAQMVTTKQQSESQYLGHLSDMQSAAISAYAEQISATMQRNQMYLNQYSADVQTMAKHADIMYNAANLSLGITQAESDMANQYYEQSLAPYYQDLQTYQLEQSKKGFLDYLIGGLELVGGAVLTIATGGTAAVPGVSLMAAGGKTLTS